MIGAAECRLPAPTCWLLAAPPAGAALPDSGRQSRTQVGGRASAAVSASLAAAAAAAASTRARFTFASRCVYACRCGHTLTTIAGPDGDLSSAKLVLFGTWAGRAAAAAGRGLDAVESPRTVPCHARASQSCVSCCFSIAGGATALEGQAKGDAPPSPGPSSAGGCWWLGEPAGLQLTQRADLCLPALLPPFQEEWNAWCMVRGCGCRTEVATEVQSTCELPPSFDQLRVARSDPALDLSGIRLAGATNDVHIMDVRTGKWEKVVPQGEPPSPRAAHAAAAVGNMVVVQGGIGPAGLASEDLHVLDFTDLDKPRWHRWVLGALSGARSWQLGQAASRHGGQQPQGAGTLPVSVRSSPDKLWAAATRRCQSACKDTSCCSSHAAHAAMTAGTVRANAGSWWQALGPVRATHTRWRWWPTASWLRWAATMASRRCRTAGRWTPARSRTSGARFPSRGTTRRPGVCPGAKAKAWDAASTERCSCCHTGGMQGSAGCAEAAREQQEASRSVQSHAYTAADWLLDVGQERLHPLSTDCLCFACVPLLADHCLCLPIAGCTPPLLPAPTACCCSQAGAT